VAHRKRINGRILDACNPRNPNQANSKGSDVRLKARTDENHAEIVRAFRSVPSVKVHDTSRVGGGFPDIIVFQQRPDGHQIHLVEIKRDKKQKLTKEQIDFHAVWPCYIVTSVEDVWAVLGV